MKKFYHVMGSDIPHHNNTVLEFFAERLNTKIPFRAMAKFLIVGKGLREKYPRLNIIEFPSKRAIAHALTSIARRESNVYFYLHGQFNILVWLAILFNCLPSERLIWHIWGADLYEDSPLLRFKLVYPLRRWAQRKLKRAAGTQGDLNAFARLNPTAERIKVYFPTKMNRTFQPPLRGSHRTLTVLLGNSGDRSNRHREALYQIKQALGENIRIIVPMGYPPDNNQYIAQVNMLANQLFPMKEGKSKVEILTGKLVFNDYLQLLAECDVGYFIFQRQQGIGTICLLTQLNIPVVLHRQNTFCEDMRLYQVPFLFNDEVSRENIIKTREKLTALNKETIAFFDPYFIDTWLPLPEKILSE